jgi:hypothetical protein
MACLRLYGDSAARATAEKALISFGAAVENQEQIPDPEVVRRLLTYTSLGENAHPELAAAAQNPTELASLIARKPELLRGALVVRGRSFMLGADPSRLQSLMY